MFLKEMIKPPKTDNNSNTEQSDPLVLSSSRSGL